MKNGVPLPTNDKDSADGRHVVQSYIIYISQVKPLPADGHRAHAVRTVYMDIINECEKLGDYVVNVVEARMGTRQK